VTVIIQHLTPCLVISSFTTTPSTFTVYWYYFHDCYFPLRFIIRTHITAPPLYPYPVSDSQSVTLSISVSQSVSPPTRPSLYLSSIRQTRAIMLARSNGLPSNPRDRSGGGGVLGCPTNATAQARLLKWMFVGGLLVVLLYQVSRKMVPPSDREVLLRRREASRKTLPMLGFPDTHFKKASDPKRGWLFEATPSQFDGSTHVFTILPGAVRGNHYHKVLGETIVFFGDGTALIRTQNVTKQGLASGPVQEYIIGPIDEHTGDGLRRFYLPAYTAHAVKNIGKMVAAPAAAEAEAAGVKGKSKKVVLRNEAVGVVYGVAVNHIKKQLHHDRDVYRWPLIELE
jgi:hypothetical protein